jgi:hypothetical protein
MVGRRRRPGHRRNCRADFGVAVAAMRKENSTGLAGLRRGRQGVQGRLVARPGPGDHEHDGFNPALPAARLSMHISRRLRRALRPDARPAGLSADLGRGGRPGEGAGPGRPRPVVRGRSSVWQPDRPLESLWLVVSSRSTARLLQADQVAGAGDGDQLHVRIWTTMESAPSRPTSWSSGPRSTRVGTSILSRSGQKSGRLVSASSPPIQPAGGLVPISRLASRTASARREVSRPTSWSTSRLISS